MYVKSSETYERCEKVMTFAGGTTDDPGDSGGANATSNLFVVSGVVAMKLFAVVEVTCTGASATIAVGTAITAGGLIAQTTATGLAAGELWHDNSPDASVEATTVAAEKIVSQTVKQVVATADVTAGRLRYICLWRPLSAGATVTPA